MPNSKQISGAPGWKYPIWDRQPFEGPNEFIAFRVFRGIVGAHRTLLAVQETLGNRYGLDYAELVRLSSEHHWIERARQFDIHCSTEHAALVKQKTEEIQARQLHTIGIAGELVKSELLGHVQQIRAARAEGNNMPVAKLSDLTRLLDVVTKLERLVRGESTENVNGTIDMQIPDYSGCTDEELAVLERIEQRAAAQRLDAPDPLH